MMAFILAGIFMFIFIMVFCASIDYLFDLFERISQFIEKRKRKNIIKKLKEMPTWDQISINLLKSLKEEDKK